MLLALGPWSMTAQEVPTKSANKTEEPATALTREIRHQILVLPFYSVFDFIHVTVKGNNVTLEGQVLRRSLREQAQAAVRNIEGVGEVANRIEVLPSSPGDDDLRNSIYRAVYEDSSLERYATEDVPPVHIIVKDATVTLEGAVNSSPDKNLAGTRAANVANVRSVKNNLAVHPKEGTGE